MNLRASVSCSFASLILLAAGAAGRADKQVVSYAEKRASEYLVAHHQSPEDYILSRFKDHEIVFLGECTHGAKQNLIFLQGLLPKLYAAGIYNLGYEMVWSEDQADIDRLITADNYDEEKALALLFKWDPEVGWAFKEYADVFRAAWTINHGLRKGQPRFRIVATDLRPDWSLVKPGDALVSRPTRWKAWWGSNQISRNVWMSGVIQREFAEKGLKALVYNGSGHTTLAVTRDQREETGLRFSAAYQLRCRLGPRVTSVEFHSSINEGGSVATPGAKADLPWTRLIQSLPAQNQAIGFDLKGTPVGDLPMPEPLASAIVAEKKPSTLADYVTDGIVQLSLTHDPVTPAPGFITEARVAQAKRDGWLPDVPEITADWILQHQRQFLATVH